LFIAPTYTTVQAVPHFPPLHKQSINHKMPVERRGIRALQIWCRRVTDSYENVNIIDMSSSWRDGLGFCAIIHHFRPNLIDYESLSSENIVENNNLAYTIAEEHLGLPALLDPQDMLEFEEPDKFSIVTYVSQFYHLLKDEDQSCCSPSLNRVKSSDSEHDNSLSSTDNTPVGTPKTVPKSIFNSSNPVLRNNKFSPDLSIKLNESTTLKTACSDSVTISSVCQDLSRQLYIKPEKET